MARIAGINIPVNKHIVIGLTPTSLPLGGLFLGELLVDIATTPFTVPISTAAGSHEIPVLLATDIIGLVIRSQGAVLFNPPGSPVRVLLTNGIDITLGTENTLEDNFVERSFDDGLDIETDDNTVTRNVIKKVADDGVAVSGSGNVFTDNKAKKSGAFDLLDDAGEGANTYAGNKFEKTSFQ